ATTLRATSVPTISPRWRRSAAPRVKKTRHPTIARAWRCKAPPKPPDGRAAENPARRPAARNAARHARRARRPAAERLGRELGGALSHQQLRPARRRDGGGALRQRGRSVRL